MNANAQNWAEEMAATQLFEHQDAGARMNMLENIWMGGPGTWEPAATCVPGLLCSPTYSWINSEGHRDAVSKPEVGDKITYQLSDTGSKI